jgi:peptidoglycan/xylan/chitin deacetylase (PgdA/CDA1 family)
MMPSILRTLFTFCCISLFALAQDSPPTITPVQPPAGDPTIPDDGVRVAVLGYHDLGENLPETEMRIHTSKFRKQMETIQHSGIKVISMEEFIAWKKGDISLPAQSILLTFDDGWKSVYTDAFPVLKEMKFPFTLFLYKDYVDGGGKALTIPMIQEMIANGATIGSHSVSHPYPITVKSHFKKGTRAYDAYLRKELGESKFFLESKFSAKVNSYAYPGGYHTVEMHKLGTEFGYQCLFTVIPGKIKRSLPNETLPRYIILGNYDKIFDQAISFRENSVGSSSGGSLTTLIETTPYPVSPEAGAIINTRLPEITADLSTVPDLNPATLSMKVSGFGEVPATFSPETKKLSWTVNRALRHLSCQVSVTWKDSLGKSPESPLRWSFKVDRDSAYLPDLEPKKPQPGEPGYGE